MDELDKFLEGKFCPILNGNRQCLKEDCLAFNKEYLTYFGYEIIYSCNICKWKLSHELTKEEVINWTKENKEG